MVKENEVKLKVKNRIFGQFVKFTKIGPTRNILCLQNRIDNLFNKNFSKKINFLCDNF